MSNHALDLFLLYGCKLFNILEKLFIFRVVNGRNQYILLLYLSTELTELRYVLFLQHPLKGIIVHIQVVLPIHDRVSKNIHD